MITVRSILQAKGEEVISISPAATVYKALQLMAEQNIGALLVLEKGAIAGLLSERDYARKVILHGRSSRELRVSQIMTTEVHRVGLEQGVGECMALMTERRVRHLPVVEGEKVVGLISIGDVVKALLAEQESTIKLLENYITGGA